VPFVFDVNLIHNFLLTCHYLTNQQKARFKAVESLRSGTDRAIVVSTDVAARGLDIPNVATVIHYDVARAVDTFIHRAGRTAVSTIYIVLLNSNRSDDDMNILGLESPKPNMWILVVPLAVLATTLYGNFTFL
jgi:superfamily II DNA/RNA helicase